MGLWVGTSPNPQAGSFYPNGLWLFLCLQVLDAVVGRTSRLSGDLVPLVVGNR